MHPKGDPFSPERPKFQPQLEEKESSALNKIRLGLKDLESSLINNDEQSIKYIYGRILDEQQGTVPNKVLIDQLKYELMGAVMPFYNQLKEALNYEETSKILPQEILDIAKKLLEDVNELVKNPLPNRPDQNPFRISVWRDRVGSAIRQLDRLHHTK